MMSRTPFRVPRSPWLTLSEHQRVSSHERRRGGKGSIGFLKEFLAAIAINGLLQNSLQGLMLFVGEFPQNRQGVFINANAGAGHVFIFCGIR